MTSLSNNLFLNIEENKTSIKEVIGYLERLKKELTNIPNNAELIISINGLINSYSKILCKTEIKISEVKTLCKRYKLLIPILIKQYEKVDEQESIIITAIIDNYKIVNIVMKGSFWRRFRISVKESLTNKFKD